MKKILMVLSFALCTSFVIAQTATPNKTVYMAKSETSNVSNMYQSSIFTKDATPLVTVDFSPKTTTTLAGSVGLMSTPTPP